MTQTTVRNFLAVNIPTNSPAIKLLGLWFGLLVFFFSPEVVHAEFPDGLNLLKHLL